MNPPEISKDLLKYLKTIFPFSPSIKTQHREIDHMIGQQSVISHLESILNEREELSN